MLQQRISAGFPSPADDYLENSLDLNTYLVRNKAATFFFRVIVNSMTGANIHDGDILVVDRSIEPRHRHLVLAVINNEYTVKRLHCHDGTVELHAENPAYPPIRFREHEELQVWGVVVGAVARSISMAAGATGSQQLFVLANVNNFYVSCERVFNPALEKCPVVVLSNNEGCAIARSNEVTALGVKMGAPWFQLQELAQQHNIVALSSNYALYGDMSSRVASILRDYSPNVEVYSIDESFLGPPAPSRRWPKSLRRSCKKPIACP